MTTKSKQTNELPEDDDIQNRINPLEFLGNIWKKLESVKHNKEEQTIFLDTLEETGFLINLVDLLAHCDSEIISKVLVSCIRLIADCSENKYIQIMIKQTLSLKSSLPAPTFGIFCVLEAVSWCDGSIRHQIVNEDTLNYVLSNINIKNVKLAKVQSRLLFILMHLEYSVGGDFIAKQLDDITMKLNHFLNMQDITILENTLNCFSKFVFSNKAIPQQSMIQISNLLATNNLDLVEICLKGVENLICSDTRFTTFENLATTVELFTKCNLWQNLSIAFNFLMQNHAKNEENCVWILCNIIDKCLEFVNDEDIAEYMVHSMIENNLIRNVIKFVDLIKPKWHFKLLWKILKFAKDEDVCFMIICMDIIPYLCNKKMYFELIKMTEKLNQDKPWLNQDTSCDVQILIYFVFSIILNFDEIYQPLNDKNVCTKLLVEYGAIDLMETIRKHIKQNNDEKLTGKCKQDLLKRYGLKLKELRKEMDGSESCHVANASNAKLIVSFKIREYNKEAVEEIPSCIESLIEQFYLTKCDLVVPYLKMQFDVDGIVIINKKKICGFCQNVQMNMQRCSGCKYVFYCNQLCQRKDWKSHHKSICAKIKRITPV